MSVERIINNDSVENYQNNAFLERPRLQKLLEDAMNYPLIAVYAGAGYGKTRTVYSFLQKSDINAVWVQLSELDNETVRYWESYTHALSASWQEAGAVLAEIGFPETDEAFAKFASLLKEADNQPHRVAIVFDDFHLLHNPAILRHIERVVNVMPSNATVILLSRTVPEINMIGMMMRERIFSIREDVLCFTEDEIAEYFNLLALPVSRQDIRDIYEDTRGWAFAINLIGRSQRKAGKYERYALEAMKTNIFKLIETEIAQTISVPLWRFLLRLSLIDHLASSLINVLATDKAIIKEMERLNAYIRYDFYMDAYMIHHLFLEYLRQNQYVLTEKEKQETYQEAGEWCECNNYHADALSYYEKSEDYDSIMRIVASFNVPVPQDIAKYALEVFGRIPEEVASQNPQFPVMNLKLKICLGLLDESSELVRKYVSDYEGRPESATKDRALAGIYGAWAILRLMQCTFTDVYDFDIYFDKQRKYYDKNPYTTIGLSINQPVGAWVSVVGTNRAGAQEEFIEAVSRSIPYVSRTFKGNSAGLDDLARGELCFLRREINSAEQYLKQALEKARVRKQYDIQSRALFYAMRIAFSRGDLAAANKALQSMEKLLSEKDYVVRYATYDLAYAFYHLSLYQPDQVPEWLKADFMPYVHPAFMENYANHIKAHYHFQTRQYSALLAYIENEREQPAILFARISLHVLKALSLYQLKRREEAIEALTEAYKLASPNKVILPFIDCAKEMRTLTAAALKDDDCQIARPWLEDINRKASAFAKRQAHMISEYKVAAQLDQEISLTKRETEILKDLSQGLSRVEIAASLNISANTVKMFINIIYDKLSASSLPDAISIAKDRKII